jgi:hypothetical protein
MRYVAPPEPPRHYVRLESNEVASVSGLDAHVTGVVVGARFDASHWRGGSGGQLMLPETPAPGFELRYEVERLGFDYLLDLETWRLPELRDHEDRELGRTARTFIAQALDLPLTVESLTGSATLDELCRAAIETQVGATLIFAPYFTVSSLDDPWVEANLRCLKATIGIVSDQEVAVWVRLERRFATDGTAELLAQRYAATLGGRPATVVLTVAEMSDVMRDVETLSSYLRLVRSFANEGLKVIVDAVGEFSPTAISIGATGSIAGTRTYRNAPLRARPDGRTRRQPKLMYLVPERFQRLSVADARRRTASGSIPRCPRANCRALLRDGDRSDLRHHNAHLLADTAALAQSLGPQRFAERLKHHGLVTTNGWAQALVDASDVGTSSAEA